FHRVEILAVLVAGFVEADDVGVRELLEGVDLALEALEETGFEGQVGDEDFEGGLAPAVVLLGQVDAAHAAVAEFLLDGPLAQALASHGGVPQGFLAAYPKRGGCPLKCPHENRTAPGGPRQPAARRERRFAPRRGRAAAAR